MFDTKFSRRVAFWTSLGVVVVGSLASPWIATALSIGFSFYGGFALYTDVIEPWIDAGDDDDVADV